MDDRSYKSLEKKYRALLKENQRLKARVQVLESGADPPAVQSRPLKTDDPQKSPASGPEPASRPEAGVGHEPLSRPDRLTRYALDAEKIAFFMGLFKARRDVYARKWHSKKGKSGYSPACLNEWKPGVCKKPLVKCFNCRQKAHAPLNETVIESHLRGSLVVGVYPLKRDETCHFLAIDFDKQEWEKDISAIRKICSRLKIPLAVERSQSGNGCHAWFFFRQRVPAALARKFATALLTHAMEKRHEISFKSYDRLFPNQDTMPRGGYGNLIALPLQKTARDKGNSVFIDEDFRPYPDQWDFLSGTSKLDETDLNAFIKKLIHGQDLGILKNGWDEGERPWDTAPRGLNARDFPEIVEIVKSEMVYVTKKGISPRALNTLKRCAAFKNPQFYKAQAMRLPTYGKPRVISCTEDHNAHLALPRGCEQDLCSLLEKYGVCPKWVDRTHPGKGIHVEFSGVLKNEQQAAADALLAWNNGVLAAATAFGKTVIGAKLIASKKVNTLVLVHRQQLVSQWQDQLARFLVINEPLADLPGKRGQKRKQGVIGHLAAGQDRLGSIVDIALMQSLNKGGKVRECVKNYGMIIVDECHHVPAVTFEQILKFAAAKTIYGLTATPARPDGHHPIIFFYCRPVRFSVDAKKEAEKRPFDHCLIPRFTSFRAGPDKGGDPLSIHEIKARLVSDEIRN